MANPTPKEDFERQAVVVVPLIAEIALDGCQTDFTPSQRTWFVQHCDAWVRWFHANDPKWTKPLNGKGNKGRDKVRMFVQHWAQAFEKDPEFYQERHPMEDLV